MSKILDKLKTAAQFRYAPLYSLFHTDRYGNYTLIRRDISAERAAELFAREAAKPETCGLEIRCDGIRVDL